MRHVSSDSCDRLSALACFSFGICWSVSDELFCSPLRRTLSVTLAPGDSAPIFLARSRESLTASPLTAVMTSPALTPALAAGPSACASSTMAPSTLLHAEAVGDALGHALHLHADPAALDEALVLELGDHGLHRLGRDAEADADRAAGRRVDRGVHRDHIAVDVEGRPAGVALVDRRVDLDEVVIRAGADVAAARRDDARRRRCRRGRTDCRPRPPNRPPAAPCRRTSTNGNFLSASTLISARSVFWSEPTTFAV